MSGLRLTPPQSGDTMDIYNDQSWLNVVTSARGVRLHDAGDPLDIVVTEDVALPLRPSVPAKPAPPHSKSSQRSKKIYRKKLRVWLSKYGPPPAQGPTPYIEGIILTNFTLFSKLPLEIRREIWRHALPGPQVIKVEGNGYSHRGHRDNDRTVTCYIYRPRAYYKIPILMKVCEESRTESMHHNRPAFMQQFGGIPVFFNFKTDLLYFSTTSDLIHFYGGAVPNFSLEVDSLGYRSDVKDMHEHVTQIAVGHADTRVTLLGSVLNQMKALKNVMLWGNDIDEDIMEQLLGFCNGTSEFIMGWESYRNTRSAEAGNLLTFKVLTKEEFQCALQDWKGSMFEELEEDEEMMGELHAVHDTNGTVSSTDLTLSGPAIHPPAPATSFAVIAGSSSIPTSSTSNNMAYRS